MRVLRTVDVQRKGRCDLGMDEAMHVRVGEEGRAVQVWVG